MIIQFDENFINKILCHASYKNTTTKNVFDFVLITFNINEKFENSQHLSS